jgi:hypothetical protein
MTLRTFDLDDPADGHQPVEFAVRGKRKSTGEPFTEQFTTIADLPPAVLDDVSRSVVIGDDGTAYYQRHETLQFVRAAIRAQDHARWDALVRDPDRLVNLDRLVEIMLWLVGTLLNRPTGPLSNSPVGSAGTGNGSGVPSSSEVTPPEPSTGSPPATGSTAPSPS